MRVLYIGEYIPGTTSHYRGEHLRQLLQPVEFRVIDTNIPVLGTCKVFRSLGWRTKRGPLIWNINSHINKGLNLSDQFDLVWIDKADFISLDTIQNLRAKAAVMVHYTPDNAFYSNLSPHFTRTIPIFDYCITTKSFEISRYKEYGANAILFCTQGFNPEVHTFQGTTTVKSGVVFIGLQEKYREHVIQELLDNDIQVKLGGIGWIPFVKRNSGNPRLTFLGERIFGNTYTQAISGSVAGLGLLSKNFPEKHTTRTFEIPACGTVLVTERNEELEKYFSADEALFFDHPSEIPALIRKLINEPDLMEQIQTNGAKRVRSGGFDNISILNKLLKEIHII